MPNTKSAKKRHRQSLERRARNRAAKSAVKSQIRKTLDAAGGTASPGGTATADAVQKEFRLAVKKLDQAAAKGVIHKNAAARSKSRLSARLKAAKQGGAKSAAK